MGIEYARPRGTGRGGAGKLRVPAAPGASTSESWVSVSTGEGGGTRKAVDNGPRVARRRRCGAGVARSRRGPEGPKPRDTVGRWEVRCVMEWGVGLDSDPGGWPPSPWSPGGRWGTRAETCRSVARSGRDSRVEAGGPRAWVPSPASGGKGRAWLSGSDGRESRNDGCVENRRAGRAAGSGE